MWRDWVRLKGMQESALSDNERDWAAPVRFALQLKTPIRGSFEGKGRDSHADHRSIDCKKSRQRPLRRLDFGSGTVILPIRVAQVMGKMLGGGVESVVMNYYRHIDRSKVQFDFLVDADSTRVPEEEIKALGGRVFRIPPYQHPLRYREELVRLFHEEHWPIVHSHINTLSVFPLSAAKLEKFRFDPIIRQETRRELDIADDMFLVGHVGRFMPQKNQAFLVDVLAELLPQKPDTMLAFVGDGPDRPDVQQHAQALGISDHILFLGQRTDVNHLYQAFDAFCLPSRYEGLGMVAIEAQVAGCPCVLSDQVPHEADISGKTSFISLENKSSWISTVLNISSQTANRQIETSNTCAEKYDISASANRLTFLYVSSAERANGWEETL